MNYDVIIGGAGPAGCTAALYSAKFGLRTLLIDKAQFPRDKICGDGLTNKTYDILTDLNLINDFKQVPHKEIRKVLWTSPNQYQVTLDFSTQNQKLFCICMNRMHFDNFLFQKAKSLVDTMENSSIIELKSNTDKIESLVIENSLSKEKFEISAKLIIAADGAHSFLARKLSAYKPNQRHTLIGTRQYVRNINGMQNALELHFTKHLAPGYFWIFPLSETTANIGIGMRMDRLKKMKLSIRELHQTVLQSELFRDRFSSADFVEDIKGWNLPTVDKNRPLFHKNVAFIGDAAGLVDPFSGEGVGNAMLSAQILMQTVHEEILANKTVQLKNYSHRLWDRLGSETYITSKIQDLTSFNYLIDLLSKKCSKVEVRDYIQKIIAGDIPKKQFLNPLMYLKLLLA